jgi:hypothetical protein
LPGEEPVSQVPLGTARGDPLEVPQNGREGLRTRERYGLGISGWREFNP